jgi:hypothetical protein
VDARERTSALHNAPCRASREPWTRDDARAASCAAQPALSLPNADVPARKAHVAGDDLLRSRLSFWTCFYGMRAVFVTRWAQKRVLTALAPWAYVDGCMAASDRTWREPPCAWCGTL